MANETWLNTKSADLGVEIRFWGARGRSIREEVELHLGVRLGKEVSDFVESVGNASVGPLIIAVSGDAQGQMGAVKATNAIRDVWPNLPDAYIKVMDHAGESYFYDSTSNEVHAFDSLNIDSAMKTLSFSGFDKFLEWVFEEAKHQSGDTRFAF